MSLSFDRERLDQMLEQARMEGAAVAFGLVGMAEAINENYDLSPYVVSRRVVSAPDACVEVTEYVLSDAMKRALTVPDGAFGFPRHGRTSWWSLLWAWLR